MIISQRSSRSIQFQEKLLNVLFEPEYLLSTTKCLKLKQWPGGKRLNALTGNSLQTKQPTHSSRALTNYNAENLPERLSLTCFQSPSLKYSQGSNLVTYDLMKSLRPQLNVQSHQSFAPTDLGQFMHPLPTTSNHIPLQATSFPWDYAFYGSMI